MDENIQISIDTLVIADMARDIWQYKQANLKVQKENEALKELVGVKNAEDESYE